MYKRTVMEKTNYSKVKSPGALKSKCINSRSKFQCEQFPSLFCSHRRRWESENKI